MNSKIHSLTLQSSILAFALIGAGIPIVFENVLAQQDELHRSRPWGLYWLKRYVEEGIEGLKNRPKSGRHPDIPEEKVHEIKNELASSKQGWTTKQIEDLIVRKRVVVE
jgi:hypothetical protein